jgi:ribosome biogenesis GTPase
VFSLIPGALVAYGFNDRVLALLTRVINDGDLSSDSPDHYPARVTRVERTECVVVGPDGRDHHLRAQPLPAVGDWVIAAAGAVRQILPRSSTLQRGDPSGAGVQTLAANLDLVVVTTPADRSSATRVEREIAVAWDSGAVPLVVVTKADLDAAGVTAGLGARLVGVDVVAVSVVNGEGIPALRARLRPDRTAVLIGPSGAGKSTLANAIIGSDVLTTGEVRVDDRRGRHTTTSRQLIAIPGGGVLIDTPGLRSLGLTADVDIGAGFPDVEALAARCRFADCRHDGEPGCAVAEALLTGTLDPDRWRSFDKLAREAAWEHRRHEPLAQQTQRRVWKARTKDARARDRRRPPPE